MPSDKGFDNDRRRAELKRAADRYNDSMEEIRLAIRRSQWPARMAMPLTGDEAFQMLDIESRNLLTEYWKVHPEYSDEDTKAAVHIIEDVIELKRRLEAKRLRAEDLASISDSVQEDAVDADHGPLWHVFFSSQHMETERLLFSGPRAEAKVFMAGAWAAASGLTECEVYMCDEIEGERNIEYPEGYVFKDTVDLANAACSCSLKQLVSHTSGAVVYRCTNCGALHERGGVKFDDEAAWLKWREGQK